MTVRRILGYLCFTAFVMTLAVWLLSYLYSCFGVYRSWSVDVRGGGYYVAYENPPAFFSSRPFEVRRYDGVTIERFAGRWVERWKPVRSLPTIYFNGLFVVAGWVPPIIFAYDGRRSVLAESGNLLPARTQPQHNRGRSSRMRHRDEILPVGTERFTDEKGRTMLWLAAGCRQYGIPRSAMFGWVGVVRLVHNPRNGRRGIVRRVFAPEADFKWVAERRAKRAEKRKVSR